MGVSNCEVLKKGNSKKARELKKELQILMMEIIDYVKMKKRETMRDKMRVKIE